MKCIYQILKQIKAIKKNSKNKKVVIITKNFKIKMFKMITNDKYE